MNEDNKKNMKWGLEVLLLFIGISLGVGSAFGCFNYATLAKQTGDNENIFWLVGLAVLVYWVYYTIHRGKQIKNKY